MNVTPWHFFMVMMAGWINREQQNVIDYLKAENEILREQIIGQMPPAQPGASFMCSEIRVDGDLVGARPLPQRSWCGSMVIGSPS